MSEPSGSGKRPIFLAAAEQDVLGDVLHDVAQPLTVLSTVLEDAASVTEPAAQAELLALARSECKRALTALRRLQKRPAGKVRVPAHNRKAGS